MPEDASSYLQLISLAVHELRTPASVVAGYLRMLLRDGDHPLDARQRRMLEEAERSCGRLAAIIAELSEIQKLDAERITMDAQSFDLFAVAGRVASGVHEADDRGVRLEARGPSDGAPMRGDLTRIERALSAVFRAIVREMPARTLVACERQLVAEGGSTSAVLVIAADSDVQASYASGVAPFNEQRGGLGLALPFARRVIERHGGRLWAPRLDGRQGAVVSLPLVPAGG